MARAHKALIKGGKSGGIPDELEKKRKGDREPDKEDRRRGCSKRQGRRGGKTDQNVGEPREDLVDGIVGRSKTAEETNRIYKEPGDAGGGGERGENMEREG